MKALVAVLVLAVCGAALAACGGQSAEEKAQSQVCDARADIQKQVDTLQGLPLSTASISAAQSSLSSIGDDLSSIKSAQGDLSGQRKQQVQSAVSTFESQVSSIAGDLVAGLSGGQAKAQLQTALRQLATGFKSAFAPVGC